MDTFGFLSTAPSAIKTAAEIASGFATPVIAYLVYRLTKRQHDTESDRLRLDLFDRRFKVYDDTKAIIADAITLRNVDEPRIITFGHMARNASFLFDNEVIDFLENVRQLLIELMIGNGRLSGRFNSNLSEDERQKLVNEQHVAFEKLLKCQGQVDDVFKPFMRFDHVRRR